MNTIEHTHGLCDKCHRTWYGAPQEPDCPGCNPNADLTSRLTVCFARASEDRDALLAVLEALLDAGPGLSKEWLAAKEQARTAIARAKETA